ncbi:microtubule-associated protein futsch-like isoform X2 [Daphnia carinata]|uniref:microtubule-associated protein futsch-like isoform X2 n=1 Tax=Daphnia carinata TaxID=120202 RepID=UPI00257FC62A|nr:microtubule-associated protein futsch-like isoform X2 [Daphnia carinata]
MGSQRQKNGKTRKRIENSENQIQTSEPREAKANKIRFQKNKIALKDLTNKSVITPLKNMGNTTDKEDDSDQRQSINQPFGRQTRSKVKTFVSSSPIDNHKKQTNSKNKSLLDSVTKTEHSVDSKHNEETVNVGTDWSNGVKCLRATRRTVKKPTSLPENQNTATAGDVSQTSGSPAQTSIRQIPISSPNVSETDDMDKTENPSKNGLPPTDVSVPSFRMTRNMTKSHNTPTSNKSNNPKEVSPKASTKCTKSDTEETLPCQTRSQALQSSILKNGKSPQLKKKGISTASKQKRKTALEKWIEQAGEVSVLNGSSSLSGPCRKSARLSVSKLSPGKLTSTKNESKVSSPSPATKRTSKAKKVPVWRTEPKPELLHSAVDDIYGVEYDSSECKPAKKKRTRKPKKENDVFKPSKGIVAPKQTKRPLRTAAAKTEDVQKPVVTSTKGIKPPSTDKTAAKSTTPLLKAVAEKLSKMTEQMVVDEPEKEERLDDISYIYPIVNQSTIIDDVTLTENADADHSEERDKTTESGILAGDFEESQQVIQSHPDQVEAAMENLFGFEDPETYPPVSTVDKVVEKQLVKSTPIKQQTIAECFASVSPVRKVTKATRKSANRPARLDEDVARDLIRGIRPLQPAMDKQKHPSLKQYIKDVAEIDDDEETNVRNSEVPPTPPTVFSQPPRRSYSRRELRRVKRTILTVDDDDDFEPSDEEVSSKKAKKRGGGKTIHKKNKRDEEEEQWCKVMNSHFEDIEKFNLSS